MAKSTAFANQILKLTYNATPIANIADNAAASPNTSIYIALHTAYPGVGGTQSTNETAYTSYARVGVARTTGGWTVTGASVSPAAAITFPAGTGGSDIVQFFSTGLLPSGAGEILHVGAIGSGLGPFTGATSGTITIPGLSGVAVNDRITFFTTLGSTLPTGITEGTVYFVLTVSGDNITISTTSGSSAVVITASGDGTASKVTPLTTGSGITPQITTATTITES